MLAIKNDGELGMQPSFNMEPIWLTYKGAFIACDRWSTRGQLGEILLLHGGGSSGKEGFNTFRQVSSLCASAMRFYPNEKHKPSRQLFRCIKNVTDTENDPF